MLSSKVTKKYEPIVPKPLFYGSLVVTIGIVIVLLNHAYNLSRDFITSGQAIYPMRVDKGWFMDFEQNYKATLIYYLLFSAGFIYFLYGNCVIFLIGITLVNYLIGKIFKSSKLNTIVSWLFNLTILFTSKRYNGYYFQDFFLPGSLEQNRGVLDWETYFNILFCRLISYNMDYSEQLSRVPSDSINATKKEDEQWSEYRQRQETSLNIEADFNLLHYLAYIFYTPLFIGGPVCSYTAFISYVKYSTQKELSYGQLIWHTIRLVAYIILLEIYLHLFYTVGFNDVGFWKEGLWRGKFTRVLPPFSVGVIGITTLTFMYMKFLIIWRMFRLWALWDGINPPENMNRCVNNNYLVSDFWRSWHRSLYMWILRYLYIPLGGSKSKVWSVWIIFTFIALWHDLWWRWLAWAWINCCLLILEAVFFYAILPRMSWIEKLRQRSKYTFAFLCGFSGAISIITLIIANLAIMHGFADTPLFIHQLFLQPGGFVYFLTILFALPFVVMVMIHKRDMERMAGDEKKF
ncbi:predicted protein [Naegleria gruberi]|uniref:Predicted protein n=1 Tax=Naegleria gruberi TaxID=5762 RepID=D2W327_NAEGR|nr:uncharacterized protein NAEGRDRAFT_75797 [Naegleria gruberi]EFC36510.1 predicted protein [Naegleria gruberi]|eukprot:XP_002669254.1 predicted protein [Naegleria gruberi strain NEG-M]